MTRLMKLTQSLDYIVVGYRPTKFPIKSTNNVACINGLRIKISNYGADMVPIKGNFRVWCGALDCCKKKRFYLIPPLLNNISSTGEVSLACCAMQG